MRNYTWILFAAALGAAGCAGHADRNAERGPYKTIAYTIRIESSEPGAKIEVNYKPAGVTPTTVKVFGDRDGTFHNFGSDEFIVRAYPANTNQFPQTKIFRTGTMGVRDDRIPERIYFDLNH